MAADAYQIAEELLTAHWTALERRTPEAAGIYVEALARATEDPEMAGDVLAAMCRCANTAIFLNAAARDIPYEDAMAELFAQVEAIRREEEE
jgi:hypothetical protein